MYIERTKTKFALFFFKLLNVFLSFGKNRLKQNYFKASTRNF